MGHYFGWVGVSGGGWVIILGGWGWVGKYFGLVGGKGLGEGEWKVMRCLIMPVK